VLDLEPLDGSDPLENFDTIEAELADYDPRLTELPRILALSKSDLVSTEQVADAVTYWTERFAAEQPAREEWEEPADVPEIVVTSSATGTGLDELKALLLRKIDVVAPDVAAELADVEVEHRVYRPGSKSRRKFVVEPAGEKAWRVVGDDVELLIARHDLENEDALAHVEHRLRKMGVIDALNDGGFQPGDDVEIAGVVFELDPE
jgi:GTP-binding protein